MGMRTRVWIGLGVALLIVGASAGGYLYYAIGARTAEYRARAELLSWAFADRVAFDLAQGERQNLDFLMGTLVLGNVLFAQVVYGGEVLAEVSRLEEPLSRAEAPEGVWQIERAISSSGQAYWDILRSLPEGEGYVRLGLALEPLEGAIRAQIVLVAGVSAAVLALVGLLMGLWGRRVLVPSAPEAASAPARPNAPVKCLGELVIDEGGKWVEVRGERVELSPKEFELLSLLASEPGRVFSNQEILAHVWPESPLATAQDVKQYIYFLRQKLEKNPKRPELILTVRGFGYKLRA